MPRWWIPPQFIIQLHAISVKGELAVIIWIIWINHLCGWHFPIWSYYVLQWSLAQCEWIVERKPENKPLKNHICCQKRDYLFTTTTSQSFPTNSFTGKIGFQTTRRVEEVVRMVRKLSHHSGPRWDSEKLSSLRKVTNLRQNEITFRNTTVGPTNIILNEHDL